LAGAAAVASWNICRAIRSCAATRSSVIRSTFGRQEATANGGTANTTRTTSAGCTVASSATVTLRRMSQPTLANIDPNRWSRAKIWSRRTDSRSRCSGRSWCSIVAIVACSSATWVWNAMPTRSRKRRSTRVNTTRSSHVSVADAASPTMPTTTRSRECDDTPSVTRASHTAMSASGSACASVIPSEAASRRGSAR
jgi:hypothetical protein